MTSANPNVYRTGWPFWVLRIGHYILTPWMEQHKGANRWLIEHGCWRSPSGKKLTRQDMKQIRANAKAQGIDIIKEIFYPRLVDEDELRREEELLYGTNG